MRTIFILITLLFFGSGLSAQGNKAFNGGINRRNFLMEGFVRSKPGTYSHALTCLNMSEAYAMMDMKDSAFYYIDLALTGCPIDRYECKDLYLPDALEDYFFQKWKNTPQWKNFERKITEGFFKNYSHLKNPKLAFDIIRASGSDQSIRFYRVFTQDKSTDFFKTIRNIDSTNLAFIKKVIDVYGFPGISMVGKDASNDAWLLCQHADDDVAFQKKVLAAMQKLVASNDVDKGNVAYLTDRIMIAEKGVQRYGTQIKDMSTLEVYPLEDEANVDIRRKEMGLPPLNVYLNQFFSGNAQWQSKIDSDFARRTR